MGFYKIFEQNQQKPTFSYRSPSSLRQFRGHEVIENDFKLDKNYFHSMLSKAKMYCSENPEKDDDTPLMRTTRKVCAREPLKLLTHHQGRGRGRGRPRSQINTGMRRILSEKEYETSSDGSSIVNLFKGNNGCGLLWKG